MIEPSPSISNLADPSKTEPPSFFSIASTASALISVSVIILFTVSQQKQVSSK